MESIQFLELNDYRKKVFFGTQPLEFSTKLRNSSFTIEDIPREDLINILKLVQQEKDLDSLYDITENFHPLVEAFLYNLTKVNAIYKRTGPSPFSKGWKF